MTPLRTQLQSARDAYRARRYPGDLASDVLGSPRMQIGRWMPYLGAAAALAACVLIAIVLVKHHQSAHPAAPRFAVAPVVKNVNATDEVASDSSDDDSLPSWTSISAPTAFAPESDSLVPPAWSTVPSADTFDTVIVTDTTPTTQESA